MASIHLQGTLLDTLGEVDVGAVMTWTHLTNTGEVIATTKRDLIIPPNGFYSIDVEFGQIRIDYRTRNTERFIATVIVNGTSTATTIPELLNAAVPVTDPVIIQMQDILADAEAAAVTSEAFSEQLTTFDLIGSVAIFSPDTNFRTKGYLTSGDGGAGHWVQNGQTAQPVSKSPEELGDALLNDGNGNQWALVTKGEPSLNAASLGPMGNGSSVEDSATIQLALDIMMRVNSGTVTTGPGIFHCNNLLIEFLSNLTEPDGRRKIGGVTLKGVGAADGDSVTQNTPQSTLVFDDAVSGGLMEISSCLNVAIEDFLILYDSSAGDYLLKISSQDSPIPTGTNIIFRRCTFMADQVPATTLIHVLDNKSVIFEKCIWPGSDGDNVLLGENSGVNATLVDGKAIRPTFRDCVFSGDIVIRRAELVLFDNCEWFPHKGSARSSKIIFDGDKFLSTITFNNCKAFNDGDGTGIFFDQSGSTGKGGLIVNGGHFGDHLVAFKTKNFGPVSIIGTRFQQDAVGANDVIIEDGAGPVTIAADHSDTELASNVPVIDNRTLPSKPWFVHQELGIAHTFTTANYENIVTQSSVKFRGGMIRVTYAVNISSLRGTRYSVQVAVGGVAIPGSGASTTIPNGDSGEISFSRVIPSQGYATPVTVALQVKQFSNNGADFGTVLIDGGEFSSFFTVEDV